MSTEYIKFWAQRFSQHCEFILFAFKDSFKEGSIPENFTDTLDKLKKAWDLVVLNPKSLFKFVTPCSDGNNILLTETIAFKQLTQQALLEFEIKCWPDLMQHMQEEVLYFNDALLHKKWSFLQEAKWWAQEHYEGLDFVNCQVAHHKITLPNEMVSKNKELSIKYKTFISSIESCEMTRELYVQLQRLNYKHTIGTEKLIAFIESAKNILQRENLIKMLNHELDEAKWASARLVHLAEVNSL